MSLQIRNLYYLLLYAWDRLEERDDALVDGLQGTQLVELFGRVLHDATMRIARRGLDRGYVEASEELSGLRGRVELTPTLTRQLLRRGRTVCSFDELSVDTIPNRILRSTAERIIAVRSLDRSVALMMRDCLALLRHVSGVPLTEQLCKRAQLHQNNNSYRLPLAIAELVMKSSFVDERSGSIRFVDFDRDEASMAGLFQAFVRNFLTREQNESRVRSRVVKWAQLSAPDHAISFVPVMITDVCLEQAGHTTVIDTKYYRNPFLGHRGGRRVPSAHLFQLFAYVKNLSLTGLSVDGVLLYAQPEEAVDIELELQGHRIRVVTLDLAADWTAIHDKLLQIASWTRDNRTERPRTASAAGRVGIDAHSDF